MGSLWLFVLMSFKIAKIWFVLSFLLTQSAISVIPPTDGIVVLSKLDEAEAVVVLRSRPSSGAEVGAVVNSEVVVGEGSRQRRVPMSWTRTWNRIMPRQWRLTDCWKLVMAVAVLWCCTWHLLQDYLMIGMVALEIAVLSRSSKQARDDSLSFRWLVIMRRNN